MLLSFEEWAHQVLVQENLAAWQIKPGEAYCWIKAKTITFDFEAYAGNYALFLHEVAHALYPEPEGPMRNHYHGGNWADKFGALVNRYMKPV